VKMKIFIASILTIVSGLASADYTCLGRIENLNQNRDGTVSLISQEIFGDTAGRKICSLNGDWKGVSPSVCKGWLSKLLTVKASGKKVTIQYVDNNNCTSQPSWSSASAPMAFWEHE